MLFSWLQNPCHRRWVKVRGQVDAESVLNWSKSCTYGDIFLSQISQIQSKDFNSEGILKFLLQLDSIISERVIGSVVLIQNEYLWKWPFSKWPFLYLIVSQNKRHLLWPYILVDIFAEEWWYSLLTNSEGRVFLNMIWCHQ